MGDRFNTIAGWVLFAGIVALGASIVTGEIYHPERPEKMGYTIEGVEAEAGEGGAAAPQQPIETYLAAADPAKGAEVFKKCAACHNADKGGANALGPNLWGVLGEPIAQGKGGFPFSDALKGKGGNWNFDNLSEWLTSPRNFANGTKMTFAGLSKPEDRANVIAFLNQHSDSPQPLPTAAAAATAAQQTNPAAAAKEATEAGTPGKAPDQPATLTEGKAATQPAGHVMGEAAPAAAQQKK